MLYLLLSLVFINVFIIVIYFYSYFRKKKQILRLNNYIVSKDNNTKNVKEEKGKDNLQSSYEVIGKKMIKAYSLHKYRDKIDLSLIKADIPLMVEELIFMISFLSLSTLLIGLMLIRNFIASVLLTLIMLAIVWIIIKSKGKKRLNIINEQLGDAINMFAGSLRAGHSFAQAMEVASVEMPLPISKELSRVVKEMNLGVTADKAMSNLLQRVPLDDLELMITAVLIQRQIGGNLAEIMDNISGTIRERIRLKSDVKTLTAQGRLSGWIVGLLPVFLIIIVSLINPEYMKVLFTDKIGFILLGIGIFNEIIGVLIIKKVIDIQF